MKPSIQVGVECRVRLGPRAVRCVVVYVGDRTVGRVSVRLLEDAGPGWYAGDTYRATPGQLVI